MSTDREAHLAAFAAHVRQAEPPAGAPHTPAPVANSGSPPRQGVGKETKFADLAQLLARPSLGDESWAERLRRWFDDPRVATGGLVALALVAGVFFYRSSLGSPGGATAEAATRSTVAVSTTRPRELVVHVSGAVAAPGVYRMPPGARVTDAITMAGGPLEAAEPHRLNLAAALGDGQRVYVPAVGEALPPDAVGAGGEPSESGPVNVNTATKAQLEALPGVGPSLADAILSERQKRGGFQSVDDLLSVRGIGDQRLADLRPLVTV